MQRRTPFYWACTQGDITVIDYLYQAGCNINHKSELGRTALSKACYLGRIDVVMFLLQCEEIDLCSQCKKGRTALHNAVFGPKGGR
jgi:ankyrin repeat protein